MRWMGWLNTALALCVATSVLAQQSEPAQSGTSPAPPAGPPAASESVAYIAGLPSAPFEFHNLTTDVVIGGAIGGLISSTEGKHLLAENGVPDPSDTIARQVAEIFAKSRGLSIQGPVSLKGQKPETKITDLTKSRYTVGAITLKWGLDGLGFRNGVTGSVLNYKAQVIIADVVAHKPLLTLPCTHDQRSPDENRSFGALMANGAAGLKSLFDQVAAECVREVSPAVQKL